MLRLALAAQPPELLCSLSRSSFIHTSPLLMSAELFLTPSIMMDEYIKYGGELFNGFQHETERIPAHRLEELHQLGTDVYKRQAPASTSSSLSPNIYKSLWTISSLGVAVRRLHRSCLLYTSLQEHIEGVRHAEDTVTALLGGHEALAYLAALRDGQILQENEGEHYAAQIAEAGAAWETVLEGVSFEDLSRLRHLDVYKRQLFARQAGRLRADPAERLLQGLAREGRSRCVQR